MDRILVVEDELKIARLVKDYLIEAGFEVLTARDGKGALAMHRSHRPDLIVLDLGLPELDGLEVTRGIRRSSTVPIVILTARTEESDRVVGLELGADDYVVKPFSPRELVARVKAVLRRTNAHTASEVLRVGDLEIDALRRTVIRAGSKVDLTTSEFDLLSTLAASPGRVYTRAQLLDALRGVATNSYERSIDSHVKNLRRKLDNGTARKRIETVYGVGYRLTDET